MRITQEADYAIRICAALAQTKNAVGAPHISEKINIPPSFTSKILRKLMLAGLVKSTRGINGGFSLLPSPKDITLLQIIETIDGVTAIRHCLLGEHKCTAHENKEKCRFHHVFEELNQIIISRLNIITLADMIDESIPISQIISSLRTI